MIFLWYVMYWFSFSLYVNTMTKNIMPHEYFYSVYINLDKTTRLKEDKCIKFPCCLQVQDVVIRHLLFYFYKFTQLRLNFDMTKQSVYIFCLDFWYSLLKVPQISS